MLETLDNGLQVLELAARHGTIRANDVMLELSVSRPSAFRLLATLSERGYLQPDGPRGAYAVGPAVSTLAGTRERRSLTELAASAQLALRDEFGETVNLAAVHRHRIVYASILDGVHSMRLAAEEGEPLPAHGTALGKAILAGFPDSALESFTGPEPYQAFTERTVTSRAQLRAELADVRRRGYAIDDQEMALGAVCVAASVLGRSGLPVGGLSIAGLVGRMPPRQRPAMGESARRHCDQVSRELRDRG